MLTRTVVGYHPPMNAAAAGKVYPEVAFTVDPGRVAAFRQVFDQREGVPTTFVTAAEFTVIPDIVADPELGLDFSRILHGSQEYEFRRPLREGETLTIRSRIESIRSARRELLPHAPDRADRPGRRGRRARRDRR